MKKLVLLASAFATMTASLSIATPASAHSCETYYPRSGGGRPVEPSANCYSQYESSRNRDGYGYYPVEPVPLLFGLLLGSGHHKPSDGERATASDGTILSYNKQQHTWVVVYSPARNPQVIDTRDLHAEN